MQLLLKAIPVALSLYVLYLTFVKSEYFTAISDLEKLLYSEGEMAISLDKYVTKEEKRLAKVRELSKQFSDFYKAASNSTAEEFLSNPLNAFLLLKRLTQDWKKTGKLFDDFDNRALLDHIFLGALELPDEKDLEGAIHALMRLHGTYKLKVPDLANGLIGGTRIALKLTAEDCFDIGRYYETGNDYRHTVQWYQEALKRHQEEEVKTIFKSNILRALANAAYLNGNSSLAVGATVELIAEDPDLPEAYTNLGFYQSQVGTEEPFTTLEADPNKEYEQVKLFNPKLAETIWEWRQYESLCREEKVKTDKELSKLSCHYSTNDNPYMLLQPIKVEVMNLSPRIVMFHDIISSDEADYLKAHATPMLRRARVQDTQTNAMKEAYFRISKSAWLYRGTDPVVDRVDVRVREVTGLSMHTAEELLVINYGIGGHYEPHWDFSNEVNPFSNLGTGNRLATLIFYLSDVVAGGGTVFPKIGINLKPRKGSAAFWFNLFKNGTGDYRTKHAACPVLAGSKWISNKWIHEREQEFRRPCSLKKDE